MEPSPTAASPTTAEEPAGAPRRTLRIALALVAGTMLYNLVEAGVALVEGVRAGSIALVGFGLDSVVECAAAGVVLWRIAVEAGGASAERVEATEARVHRFVGATFLGLAVYVLAQAAWTLLRAAPPDPSPIGLALAVLSLLLMPALSWGKLRAADRLGSAALRAEAKETLVCVWLSVALLVGLALNLAAGLWWADPAVALLMVPWLVREGLEGLRGEGCDD